MRLSVTITVCCFCLQASLVLIFIINMYNFLLDIVSQKTMDEGNNQASATKHRSFNLEEKLQSKKYNSDFAIEMKGKGN